MANFSGRRLRNPNIQKLQLCTSVEEEDASQQSDKSALLDKNVWQRVAVTDEFTCLICNKSMSGEVPAVAHANSLKHIRKLTTLSTGANNQLETGDSGENSNGTSCPLIQEVTPEVSQPISESINENQLDVIQQNTTEGYDINDSNIWDLSNGYTCLVCNKVMSGKSQAQAHSAGLKHRKKVEENSKITTETAMIESNQNNPEPVVQQPPVVQQAPVIKLKSILKNGPNQRKEPEVESAAPSTNVDTNGAANERRQIRLSRDEIPPVVQGDFSSQELTNKNEIVVLEGKSSEVIPDVENNKDIENVGGDFYKCLICGVTVSGKINMKTHLGGRLHLKNKNLQPRPPPTEETESPPKKLKLDEVKASENIVSSSDNIVEPVKLSEEVVVAGEKFEPVNKMKLMKSIKSPAVLSSKKSVRSTLLDDSLEVSSIVSLEIEEEEEELTLSDDEVEGEALKNADVQPDVDAPKPESVIDGDNPFADTKVVVRDGFDFRCVICKIFVQQVQQMQSHLEGKKHIKLMQTHTDTAAVSLLSVKSRLGFAKDDDTKMETLPPIEILPAEVVEPVAAIKEGTSTTTEPQKTVEVEVLEPDNEIDGIRKLLTFGQFVKTRTYSSSLPEPPEGTSAKGPEGTFAKGPEGTFAKGPEGTFEKGAEGTFAKGPEGTFEKGPEETSAKGPEGNELEGPSVFNRLGLSSDEPTNYSVFNRLTSGSPVNEIYFSDKNNDSDDSDEEEKYERFDRVSSRADSPVPEIGVSQISTLSSYNRGYDRAKFNNNRGSNAPVMKPAPYVQGVANTYMQSQPYMPPQQYVGQSLSPAPYGNPSYGGPSYPSYGSSPSYGGPMHSYGKNVYGNPAYGGGRMGPQQSSAFSSITPGCLSYPRYSVPSSSAGSANANNANVLSRRLGPKLL